MHAMACHIDQYRTDGYTIVEGVFTRDHADRIAQLAEDIARRELAEANDAYLADHDDQGQPVARKIETPYTKDHAFREMANSPKLVAIIAQLIDAKPLIASDQLFMKPPRFGSAKPYHQDNAYFRCSPPDHVITAWIALDDVDESNGCLRYITGSHRDGLLEHVPVPGEPHNMAPPAELIDLSRETLAPVGKGGVVFHHVETLHTSHRNNSDRWRRGYATHWVAPDVTSEIDLISRAYFHRSFA